MAVSSNNTETVTRAEAALRASEALKTAILETALDAIVTINHLGHILDFNPAAEKMFGYSRDEALGKEMADLIIPPQLRERHRVGLSRAVASGEDTIVGRRIEISAVRRDGEEFPVELAITRIRVNGSPIFTGHIRDITERRRSETALRESQQLLASITHNIADGICRWMANGELVFVNEAFLKMSGYSSLEEMRLVPPERHYANPSRRAELLALLERDGHFGHQEVEFVRKDRTTFWGLLSANATCDPATRKILYADAAVTNITSRKQAELRRAAQLAVTRVLADAPSLSDATPQILQAVCVSLSWDLGTIWHVDRDFLRCVDVWHAGTGKLRKFGQATRDVTFSRRVGLPGRVWATGEPHWISDVARDRNFPRASLANEAGLHGAFAFPIRLGKDVLGVIEFFSREIREPNADVLEMFAAIGGQIGQFIERKRAEAALRQLNADLEQRVADATRELRESQERFSKAFRASPVFMSIARLSDGEFVEVNEAFLQSGGWTRQQVIGHTSAELEIWPSVETRNAFLSEVQRAGYVHSREVQLHGSDGRVQTLLLSAELIEIGGQPHILAVSLNIDARKQAEEEMHRALQQEKELSRLKTNFVTLVSHEFRTPLGIIMSAADILQKYFDRLSPARRGEHLQDIHDASRRMAELMDEVLLLARVEAGRMECKPAPLDLHALCQRLADETRSATANACPIILNGQKLNGASADESLLRHIFINLLSNAVKYSAPGKEVNFTIERSGENAIFTVRDRGIGIPEESLSQLFQTFRRGANVGERPGSGLGLVIVKHCVELHGGAIDVESKESKGTTVTVRLPLFAAGTRSPKKKPKPAPRKSVSRRTKP
jgi:PAS domain S-box-containing protein